MTKGSIRMQNIPKKIKLLLFIYYLFYLQKRYTSYKSISYYFQHYDLLFLNAAKDGDLEGVMSALKNGADVNYGDEVSFK